MSQEKPYVDKDGYTHQFLPDVSAKAKPATKPTLPTSKKLQDYAAHCPSCGSRLRFAAPLRAGHVEAVQARCSHPVCRRRWSLVFDLDPSGTFGVMSFQCDNEDRIT